MSEAGADPVSIRILDKEYLITCTPAERADLQRAAALLNTRLRETRESGKTIGTERLLMMAALNMANDLAKLQAREERVATEFGSRVKAMRERVERALVQGQQLEL
jgi:cell division protein ZapA